MNLASGRSNAILIFLELLLLFIVIALLRLLFVPFSIGVTTVVVVWFLLALASYLVGEFESTARANYGLTIRTQAAFALAYVAYSVVHSLWSWCEPLTVKFWLALWCYLNFVAPVIGVVLRWFVPQKVLFVTDFNSDKVGLLRWWGFQCRERILIEDLERWMKENSDKAGRIDKVDLIVVDITDPKTDYLIVQVAPRYFIDFVGIPSFRMSAYFLSPHPRPIGPFVPYSIGRRLKRIVDLIISLLALLLLALPMLVVAILIKLTSPGPVFYKHRRLGRNMREFDLLKFRTMYKDAGQRLEEILKSDPKKREEFARTFKLKDDPRVTPLGRWLRKFSIDELPQLFNVLVGQMSLVGPRPIVEKEVEYYRDYSLLLFRVPPGLTGLWQVSGRTDTSYEERVKLDTRYVREWTLAGDLVIILKTVPAVLSRRGAY
ncbi:MAG: sugar transferase [candidate division WOR-3 bacterium]|jgi:undecaprenyl-phosphate galactose phosphotransferase|nr:sugar transferase [candidate division WOR-3 bacterium]MDH7519150.1 sugar transferase [bacterium]